MGFVGIGAKKSELPISKEDRLLLSAVAASSALSLENRLLLFSPEARVKTPEEKDTQPVSSGLGGFTAENGAECPDCLTVHPRTTKICPDCGTSLAEAHVPHVLPGKFRFEQRLGLGGMGVVYRAVDLASVGRWRSRLYPRSHPSTRFDYVEKPEQLQRFKTFISPSFMEQKPGGAYRCSFSSI